MLAGRAAAHHKLGELSPLGLTEEAIQDDQVTEGDPGAAGSRGRHDAAVEAQVQRRRDAVRGPVGVVGREPGPLEASQHLGCWKPEAARRCLRCCLCTDALRGIASAEVILFSRMLVCCMGLLFAFAVWRLGGWHRLERLIGFSWMLRHDTGSHVAAIASDLFTQLLAQVCGGGDLQLLAVAGETSREPSVSAQMAT